MRGAIVNLHATQRGGTTDRLDAEYFENTVSQMEMALTAIGGKTLGDVATISDERVEDPRADADGDDVIRYMEISDVDTWDGFVLVAEIPAVEAPTRARNLVRCDQLAVSSVRPARNAVVLVTEDFDQALASTGFIVLNVHGIDPSVLFAILKTPYLRRQMERRSRASMYPALHPPDILQIVIPQLTASVSSHVSAYLVDAKRARQRYLAALAELNAMLADVFAGFNSTLLAEELATRSGPRILRLSEVNGRLDAEFHASAFAHLAQIFHEGVRSTA